jgi:hypothetical protein
VFDEGAGISTKEQQYDPTSIINEVRSYVEAWRRLPNPNQWQVTPETARLLQHWRSHKFSGVRPFFCQVEAAETAIWITEAAAQSKNGKRLLDHLAAANQAAFPPFFGLSFSKCSPSRNTPQSRRQNDDNRICIGFYRRIPDRRGPLIWKKLRVVDGRLALMQNELKELHILESRLFNMIMLNAPSFKKAPDTNLSTSVPAAPDAAPEQRADGAAKQA